MPITVILGAIACGAALPIAWWSLSGERAARGAARDNLTAGRPATTNLRESVLAQSASERVLSPMMQRFSTRGQRLTPQGLRDNLQRRIQLAGLSETWSPERVYAMKAILGLVGVAVSFLVIIANPSGLVIVASILITVILFFAPDAYLHSKADDRQRTIERQLADVLDQITVCVEAGLSFDNAVLRVANGGSGPLPEELGRTLQDVQLGLSRSAALERLLERTDVNDLRSFVHAFNQAERYGIPVAQILRVQSGEIRLKRRQHAEEAAMKLPVKLVFPTVLCILPALFVVVAGPAAIRVVQAFSQT